MHLIRYSTQLASWKEREGIAACSSPNRHVGMAAFAYFQCRLWVEAVWKRLTLHAHAILIRLERLRHRRHTMRECGTKMIEFFNARRLVPS